jgi:hypothetical protein
LRKTLKYLEEMKKRGEIWPGTPLTGRKDGR